MSVENIVIAQETEQKESSENVCLIPEEKDEDENDSKSSQSNYSSAGSEKNVDFEREEGDGQEGVPFEKVDDDEDKKNPQYIPKKGIFYEHDDRTVEVEETESTVEKTDKVGKKTVWIDKKDHWGHDKYNDSEQAPKSKAELIAIYGYDIRNEDGPPKARRRRRYGRGPSKYTRNWEDEDAYRLSKPEKNPLKKPTQRKYKLGDFVPHSKSDGEQDINTETILPQNSNENSDNLNDTTEDKKKPNQNNNNNIAPKSVTVQEKSINRNKNSQNQQHASNKDPPGGGQQKKIEDSDYKGFTKSRQYRSVKSEQKILPKGAQVVRSQSFTNRNTTKTSETVDGSANQLSKMNINDVNSSNVVKSGKQNRQANVPPRLQTEQKGSKRYSSLRQRSLPETSSSPSPHTSFYPNEFTHQRSQQPPAAVVLPHSNTPIHTNAVPIEHVAPAPLQPIPQQLPVPNPPILQTQSHYVTPYPPGPPPFLQPTVAQQTFIPAQPSPAALINYVPGQPQFPHPQTGPYEGFQAQQFSAVTQQAELCQYQGGTTYYSTQNQHIPQRPATIRRPKAAIPIIPPPQDSRGRGRSTNVSDKPSSSPITEEGDPAKSPEEKIEYFENAEEIQQ